MNAPVLSKTLPIDDPSDQDLRYRRFVEGRLIGLRINRYSWWTHARELADYFLPRRYKWIVTPNQQSRGSPINQHIIDNTGTFAARNLAAGMLTGKCNPTRQWFKLRIGRLDSTTTSPVSLWLAECERITRLVFAESNFYPSIATFMYDLVIFGTASIVIYEDFDDVINCATPCFGEYYVDIDGKYRPTILYREFTMTVSAIVDEFGYENCPKPVRDLYDQPFTGANLTREFIVAHAIEPNNDDRDFGVPKRFKFRECYWVWGGSASPQGGGSFSQSFLRKRGYYEQPNITGRWDLVSNDAYGRSPAMDGLGDQKQLQLETRRKAQAIDKMVNPPLIADIQMKNQPASLLPGAINYIAGMMQQSKTGMASIYETKFPVNDITADIEMVKDRIRKVFFNDLFQTITQYQTRSNVTAAEIDARRSEAMIMLGPVLERIDYEVLQPIISRTFGIMLRAGILPKAPKEVQGQGMNIEFVSMLTQAQDASQAGGIERVLQLVGGLVGVKPEVMDNLDIDYTVDKYSALLNNDPKMIRSPEELAAIRQKREQQEQAAAMAQQADTAQKLSAGAKTLSETPVRGGGGGGGATNALEAMMQGGGGG